MPATKAAPSTKSSVSSRPMKCAWTCRAEVLVCPLFRLQALHIVCEVMQALLDFAGALLAHAREHRSPDWHVLRAVRRNFRVAFDALLYLQRRERSAVTLGQHGQVWDWRLHRRRRRSVPFSCHPVTRSAVGVVHFFARGGRRVPRGNILDLWLGLCDHNDRDQENEKNNEDRITHGTSINSYGPVF